MTTVEVRGLTKRFGRERLAVQDLTFSIEPGRVTGFLGPNGAGKSTTMRMMTGLTRPTAGAVLYDGRPYPELKWPTRTVGALLDARWAHPHRSARDHLRWIVAAAGLPRRRADESLELVGLASVAGQRVGTFSLGMSQRLALAAALIADPGVLLLDEPVNGLDPDGIHWIREFIQRLAGDGRTVLVSSHLLSEMAQTADQLVVIGRGRVLAQCSTAEFVASAGHSHVRVRCSDPTRLHDAAQRSGWQSSQDPADGALRISGDGISTDEIGMIMARLGIVVLELSLVSSSLEDAYLRVTGDEVEYQTEPDRVGAGPR